MKKENKIQARERRAKEKQKKAMQKKVLKWVTICVPVVLVAVLIVFAVRYNQTHVKAAESTETVTPTETQAVSESTENSASKGTAAAYSTDTSLKVADGDKVNIDYVGKVDGVAFDGGSTNGAGADLTIGSGSYIDGFEDQLIGHAVGDTVEVKVTFPSDYGVESLKGKDAVFTVKINGIYQ